MHAFVCKTPLVAGTAVSKIAYMTRNPPEHESHEWWKDKSDSTQTAAFSASFASHQRDANAAGWRRNMLLAVFVVSFLYLLKLIAD